MRKTECSPVPTWKPSPVPTWKPFVFTMGNSSSQDEKKRVNDAVQRSQALVRGQSPPPAAPPGETPTTALVVDPEDVKKKQNEKVNVFRFILHDHTVSSLCFAKDGQLQVCRTLACPLQIAATALPRPWS